MTENLSQTDPNASEQPHEDVPLPRKRKRWWKKILLALVVVALLLIGALWMLDVYGRKTMERALAKARKVDPLLTFEDIEAARPTWPPGKNGADIIVALSDELKTMKDETDEIEHLPILGEGEHPSLGHRWDEQTGKVVAAELGKRSDVLRKIDQLRQYEGGRFPLHIPENPLIADPAFPPIRSEIRHSIRLKGLQMLYRAMSGETARIVDDMAVLTKHGLLLANEPLLISALIRTAVEAFSVSILEDVCGLCELRPDQLLAISQKLAALDTKDRLRWATLGERAYLLAIGSTLYKGSPCGDKNSSTCQKYYTSYIELRGILNLDIAYGIELHNLTVQAGRDLDHALQIEKEVLDRSERLPFYVTISRIIMPPQYRAFELEARTVAEIRCARVALATERYRIDMGIWPEKLNQLVPTYIDEIPIDPFDSKPLKYKLTDEALIVYTIGDDRKDDGGDIGLKPRECSPTGCRAQQKDWGFALLPPSKRGMAPTTQPKTRRTE